MVSESQINAARDALIEAVRPFQIQTELPIGVLNKPRTHEKKGKRKKTSKSWIQLQLFGDSNLHAQ